MKSTNENNSKIIWLVAGGTGGHISPAVAIARELFKKSGKQKKPALVPVLVTLPRNLEYNDIRELSALGVKVFAKEAPRIPSNPLGIIRFPVQLFNSLRRLNRLAESQPPAMILAFGGYPCFPALLYARLKGIAYALHEQNRVEGMVTRLMKQGAVRLYTSFPGKYGSKTRFLGNPLRSIFGAAPQRKIEKFKTIKHILFLGGSQGATDINTLFIEMAADPRFKNIDFTISTGAGDYEKVKEKARKNDKVYSFIKDMPSVLLKSDLVIARAGSGTIYEILWAKLPSLLIPYPYAKDNHQRQNADMLEHEGRALVYDKRPFDPQEVIEMIVTALNHETFYAVARQVSVHPFPMDGTVQICHDIKELIAQKTPK